MKYFEYLKGDSRTAKVRKNIVGSFGVKGISIAISLLLVPLTIGYVSSELYGIWLTVSTIISWVALFDLGFGNGLRNKVASSVALGDWQKARSYVSTAYIYFAVLFIPISLLVFFVCPFIDWPRLLNVASEYQSLLVSVMRIVIVFFSLSMIVKIQGTVLQAMQLYALNDAFTALGQLLVLLVTFILTQTTKPSLIYLAYAISVCPVVVGIGVSIWLYGVKYKQLRPSFKLIDTSLVKNILSLGLNFFVIQIAVIVLYQTMNIVISNVAGPNAVTEYNVVYRYISLPQLVIGIIVNPFWSAFTEAYTLKDFEWMRKSYNKLLKVYLLSVIFLIILILLHPIFFRIWLGDKVDIHISMVMVVSVYIMIMMWNGTHSALINGTGLIKISLYGSIFCTVFNIPLALYLGRQWGAQGVVASVGLLNLLTSWLAFVQIRKIINNKATGIWAK